MNGANGIGGIFKKSPRSATLALMSGRACFSAPNFPPAFLPIQ